MKELLTAIKNEHIDTTLKLLNSDTTSAHEYEDEQGANLLGYALKERVSFEMAHALAIFGIDVEHFDDEGVNVLEYAITYSNHKFIEYLINERNIDATVTRRRSSFTPLMAAVSYNNLEAVKLFLDKGANIYAKDRSGFTALDFARRMHRKKILSFLQEHVAQVEE